MKIYRFEITSDTSNPIKLKVIFRNIVQHLQDKQSKKLLNSFVMKAKLKSTARQVKLSMYGKQYKNMIIVAETSGEVELPEHRQKLVEMIQELERK